MSHRLWLISSSMKWPRRPAPCRCSFTMSELYRACYVRSGRNDRLLTKEDYQKLGGVTGSLSQRADEIYRSLDAPHQETLCRVMLRMVSLQAGEVAGAACRSLSCTMGTASPRNSGKETILEAPQRSAPGGLGQG